MDNINKYSGSRNSPVAKRRRAQQHIWTKLEEIEHGQQPWNDQQKPEQRGVVEYIAEA